MSATLAKFIEAFRKDADSSIDMFGELVTREGYDFLRPTLLNLELQITSPRARAVLTHMRKPDWQWYRAEDIKTDCVLEHIRFFGLTVPRTVGKETMECVVMRGFYISGRNETGYVEILNIDDIHPGYRPTVECEDPRKAYVAGRVKQKVYRHEDSKYWIAAVGRVVDLAKSFPGKQIILTGGKGYLGQFPGFVLAQGPFDDVVAARAARQTA